MVDSRGRASETVSRDVTVLPYSEPAITTFTAKRVREDGTEDESGELLKVSYAISISELNNINSKKGTLTWTDLAEGATGTLDMSFGAYNASGSFLLQGNFSQTSRYKVTLSIADDFSSAESTVIVQTSEVILDFHKSGKGLALGKVAEGEGFECAYDAAFKGKLDVQGEVVNIKPFADLIYPVGSILIRTTTDSPAEQFGGEWEMFDKQFGFRNVSDFFKGTNCTVNTQNAQMWGHSVRVRLQVVNKVTLNDNTVILGNTDYTKLGAEVIPFLTYAVGWTDGGNGILMLSQTNGSLTEGALNCYDVITKSSGGTIASGNTINIDFILQYATNSMADSYCNKFYWRRV